MFLAQGQNPVTPVGIERRTYRFVVRHAQKDKEKEGNDQETVQLERHSHSKNRGGNKLN